MQMQVPKGRANYEPNSLQLAGEESGGPREDPENGFKTFPSEEEGQKLRIRPESFADHYSQARLFWRSMDKAEQAHIASAFVFELSKVSLEIRKAMMANLRNVDEGLARRVADGLACNCRRLRRRKYRSSIWRPRQHYGIIRGPSGEAHAGRPHGRHSVRRQHRCKRHQGNQRHGQGSGRACFDHCTQGWRGAAVGRVDCRGRRATSSASPRLRWMRAL